MRLQKVAKLTEALSDFDFIHHYDNNLVQQASYRTAEVQHPQLRFTYHLQRF